MDTFSELSFTNDSTALTNTRFLAPSGKATYSASVLGPFLAPSAKDIYSASVLDSVTQC